MESKRTPADSLVSHAPDIVPKLLWHRKVCVCLCVYIYVFSLSPSLHPSFTSYFRALLCYFLVEYAYVYVRIRLFCFCKYLLDHHCLHIFVTLGHTFLLSSSVSSSFVATFTIVDQEASQGAIRSELSRMLRDSPLASMAKEVTGILVYIVFFF